jgi:hypothetical protein
LDTLAGISVKVVEPEAFVLVWVGCWILKAARRVTTARDKKNPRKICFLLVFIYINGR